jgi:hypothetical protein
LEKPDTSHDLAPQQCTGKSTTHVCSSAKVAT